MPVRTYKPFQGGLKTTGNVNYLLQRMLLIAFLIYIIEEKVAEKINLIVTTFYL